jgi:hypothetical protein
MLISVFALDFTQQSLASLSASSLLWFSFDLCSTFLSKSPSTIVLLKSNRHVNRKGTNVGMQGMKIGFVITPIRSSCRAARASSGPAMPPSWLSCSAAASPTRNSCTARTGTDGRRLGCGGFAVALTTAFRQVCARIGFIVSGGELA